MLPPPDSNNAAPQAQPKLQDRAGDTEPSLGQASLPTAPKASDTRYPSEGPRTPPQQSSPAVLGTAGAGANAGAAPDISGLVPQYSTAFQLVEAHAKAALKAAGSTLGTSASSSFDFMEALLEGLPRHDDPFRQEPSLKTADEGCQGISPDARAYQQALSYNLVLTSPSVDVSSVRGTICSKFRHGAEVGLALLAAGLPRDVVVAGILHDRYEAYRPAQHSYNISLYYRFQRGALAAMMSRDFGEYVERLVSAVSEPPHLPDEFDFFYRKSAIWQRMRPGAEDPVFASHLASLVCAAKTSTLADGLSFLERNKTTRGWSSGSLEQNLFMCGAFRKRFEDARIPPALLGRFDAVVGRCRKFAPETWASLPERQSLSRGPATLLDVEQMLRTREITFLTGGQTGVDRAALDAAALLGHPMDGHCPAGRLAEDGPLDKRYTLQAAPVVDTAWRTIVNAHNSDATVILSRGTPGDGTPLTSLACEFYGRPVLEISLDQPVDRSAFIAFIARHRATRVNLAGPRESLDPGNIYQPALKILRDFLSPRP